jgi:hypothetical protein
VVLITQTPPDERRGLLSATAVGMLKLLFDGATDVDDVVGDEAETHPAVHSDRALVSAAVEAVSPFDDADAPLASGAPFLAVAEPGAFSARACVQCFWSGGWECSFREDC